MVFEDIISTNRKSIKRAIARFCYLNSIDLTEEEFNIFVRRTQQSGYRSAVRYLTTYLRDNGVINHKIKKLLFLFTIEYNIENYCRQFPLGNNAVDRIVKGIRLPEDEKFFSEILFDIVKANKLQVLIIEDTLKD